MLTERPPVYEFFGGLGLPTWRLDMDAAVVAGNARALAGASIALVDFGLRPREGVEVCRALRTHDALLLVGAVLCCSHSVTPVAVRALAEAGVTTMIDLEMTREEALRALRATLRGEAVLHLSFGDARRTVLADVVGGRRIRADDDLQLVELVALGLTDGDIGRRLHLSPHTVKKRIEHLRRELGVRNRTELAAWAGRQGLYGSTGERAGR